MDHENQIWLNYQNSKAQNKKEKKKLIFKQFKPKRPNFFTD